MIVSILNTEIDDTDKVNAFIEDAKGLDIEILTPDVNSSEAEFSIKEETDGIKYALGAIKNVSLAAMESVCKNRNGKGKFKDIFDFITRVEAGGINKRQLEYLIKSGAFDSLSGNRKQLFESIEKFIDFHNYSEQEKNSNQIDLFGDSTESAKSSFTLPEVKDWDFDDRLNNECAAFGFYLSGHPLDSYKDYFKEIHVMDAYQIRNSLKMGRHSVRIAGIPVVIKTRSSPKGRYIIMSLSTPTGIMDITIFDDQILEQNREAIYGKIPLLVESEVRKDGEMERVTAQSISRLDSYLQKQRRTIAIEVDAAEAVKSLETFLRKSEGGSNMRIILQVPCEGKLVKMELPSGYVCDLSKISTKNLPKGVVSLEHVVN